MQSIPPAVIETYRSPGRHYHTWDHILACLEAFRQLTFDNPRVVFCAILFHDAVYVPGRKDNEARSAALARRELGGTSGLAAVELDAIERMILLTAAHHRAQDLSADEAKFLDIDLAILGEPWPAYEKYMNGIRAEFLPAVPSPAAYRTGRIAFLRKTLLAEFIFLTPEKERDRGATARANMAREIALLRAEQGFFERLLSSLLALLRR